MVDPFQKRLLVAVAGGQHSHLETTGLVGSAHWSLMPTQVRSANGKRPQIGYACKFSLSHISLYLGVDGSGDIATHIKFVPLDKSAPRYPNRSLLRRDLDVCSISQSIHTKETPRPTTTPKNSNVRPGAVSMVSIRN